MPRAAEAAGLMDGSMIVLLIAGGAYDRITFGGLGYQNGTISNVDLAGAGGVETAPYIWSCQSSERLTVPDCSFDFVVVCADLQYGLSPHTALAKRYRGARRATSHARAIDSFLMQCGIKLGWKRDYEIEAAVDHDYAADGADKSSDRIYVYRRIKSEVDKVRRSLRPLGLAAFRYFYELQLPLERLEVRCYRLLLAVASAFAGVASLSQKLLPRQDNCFGVNSALPTPECPAFPWIGRDRTARCFRVERASISGGCTLSMPASNDRNLRPWGVGAMATTIRQHHGGWAQTGCSRHTMIS